MVRGAAQRGRKRETRKAPEDSEWTEWDHPHLRHLWQGGVSVCGRGDIVWSVHPRRAGIPGIAKAAAAKLGA